MQTLLGLLTVLAGVALVVAPWAVSRAPGLAGTLTLETLGAVVALLGLALSHRVFSTPREPRR
ncbi:MAG TPA: hypothetical protein VFL90_08145 [Methylomirabilota bacterium]|nr:hypothetical protein [Methylomirabilota bacterium]